MKILRSVNRRSFHVESAGWFSVLRPGARFTPWRLTRDPNYLGGQLKQPDRADGRGTAEPLQIVPPGTGDRHMLRWALIVAAAIAITFIALLWIDGNLFRHNLGW